MVSVLLEILSPMDKPVMLHLPAESQVPARAENASRGTLLQMDKLVTLCTVLLALVFVGTDFVVKLFLKDRIVAGRSALLPLLPKLALQLLSRVSVPLGSIKYLIVLNGIGHKSLATVMTLCFTVNGMTKRMFAC
jgi:hypothetical protein